VFLTIINPFLQGAATRSFLVKKHNIMNTSKYGNVTGASQGLGLILVKKLLENGYRVAAAPAMHMH